MILLSAHRDIVRTDIPFKYSNGVYSGLLDNEIGRLVMYSILNNPSVRELEKQGRIKLWENQHEEFGLTIDFPTLDKKKDFVINVDVCAGERYKDFDIGIENLYGNGFVDMLNGLEWEGYKYYFSEYTGDPVEADEMDQWVEKKQPGLSFIIPIECPNDNWHGMATITIEKVQKAIQILTRLICYLV